MKKFFKFLLALSMTFSALNAETIKIGTNPTYPPFEFIDKQNKITGFDMDLIELLSQKIGFKYEIINMGFDGLIPALKAGKIDAIASAMSATPARLKAVDFTKPYFVTENLFIKKKGVNLENKNDLIGKKIAVQLGTVQENAAREIKNAKVMVHEEIFSAILALKNGKTDAVMVDSSIGYGYLKKNDDLVGFYKEPDGSDGFAIAFDKGKKAELITKINVALDELKKNGSYDKLLEKYDLK